MTAKQLGRIFTQMRDEAPHDLASMNILFGVQYSKEIKECGRGAVQDIVGWAGVPASLSTEVSKGVKLARYVTVK